MQSKLMVVCTNSKTIGDITYKFSLTATGLVHMQRQADKAKGKGLGALEELGYIGENGDLNSFIQGYLVALKWANLIHDFYNAK